MTPLVIAARLARRELRGGLRSFRIFLACLILGTAAIAAIGSLAEAVSTGLREDARALLGGDVEIRLVHRTASAGESAWLEAAGTVSRSAELRAMARPAADPDGDRILVEIRAVDDAWPLYGVAAFEPAGEVAAVLATVDGIPGAAVDPDALVRLGLETGDRLRLGAAEYEIRATIAAEPDRGAHAFPLGPRVLIALPALAATDLVRPGSLVRNLYRVRLPDGADAAAWARDLEERFPDAGWRVRDPGRAAPRVRRFVERLALFLTFVGLTALLVGGVGVANATRNWLEGRAATIATLKCIGAPGGLVFRIYMIQVLAVSTIGIALGLALGALAPFVMMTLFGEVLPVPARVGLFPGPLLLAAAFGVLTAVAFSIWPLARAREIPGARLFRDLVAPSRRWPRPVYVAATGLALAALAGLAIATAQDQRLAVWFVLWAAGALLVFRLAGWLIARLAAVAVGWRALHAGRPGLRLALANLHRPGSATASVVLALGLGLTVLVAVAQIQGNLLLQVGDRLPEAAPTFYFIDIQPDQAEPFDAVVNGIEGATVIERVPSLRGRLVTIDGVPASEATIDPSVEWVIRNERGLTWATAPPPGSTITAGEWWPADYGGPPLVSMDVEIATGMGLAVGDTVTVNVLGRDIRGTIANLRRVDWATLGMNFVLIFSPGALDDAPHTHIATAGAEGAAESTLLRAVTDRFANISAIRVRDALESAMRIVGRIGAALRGTSSITILAGILVLAGAIVAGHRRRVQESVILKVLGATRADVLRAWLIEFGLLGFATALIAALLGSLASRVVVTEIMELEWAFLAGETVLTVVGATVITLLVGLAGVWRALGQRAAPLLRNQ